MKRWLFAGVLATALAGRLCAQAAEVDPLVLAAEEARIAAIARASAAAVAVFASNGQGGGSGVVITPDGYALSNFHVTRGAGDLMRCGMADGRLYDAVIVGIDPVGDVALIKLLGRNDFPTAPLGDSDAVAAGDWAFAVGNPFLLATDFRPTVTWGIVSGVHRYQYPDGTLLEYADCLQTDAAINPGNSGGPLFNAQGELIGINGRGSFEKRGRVNVGVGYAISINQIKHFLGHLRSGRIVDHATLGAICSTSADGRVVVSDILEDSDAYRRGLRYGDQIVALGGRAINTVNGLKNALGIYPRGWRVPLTYRRRGRTYDVVVRLAGVHNAQELLELVQGPDPSEAPPPPEEPAPPQPEEPAPQPPAAEPAAPEELPHAGRDLFVQRYGYANYYFNQEEVRRVWNAFVQRGAYSSAPEHWTFRGELAGGGGPAEFRLTAQSVGCTLPGGQLDLQIADNLVGVDAPPGSGGLLATLFVWRRLLMLGPEQFGDVFYVGTLPVPGQSAPCDALSLTYGGVESLALFEPQSGRLVAVETFLRSDDDPCELHFSDEAELGGLHLPRRWEVRYGERVYAVLDVHELLLGAAE